jgi:hypothetical protein
MCFLAESMSATAANTTTAAATSCWIEIYHINKETWLKELDPILAQLTASVTSSTNAADIQV